MKRRSRLAFTLAILVTFMVFSNKAFAQPDMKPLVDIMSEESSRSVVLYAWKRCSALNTVMGALFLNRPDGKELAAKHIHMGETFLTFTVRGIQSTNGSVNQNAVMEDVKGIVGLYDDRMNRYYLATGNMFDEFVLSDASACAELYKQIANRKKDGVNK
jgi:hypothetical protein